MESIGPGTRIDHFEVLQEIGRGAFGQVFRARDTLLHRDVALKVIPESRAGAESRAVDRALQEARLAGKLKSNHIATLYTVFPAPGGGGWILVMEYLEGGSLEERLMEETRLAPEEALRLLREALEGLAAAHEAGVVHGDVKPANILLDAKGTVKLVDFGLARLAGEASLSASDAMHLEGTPPYMAPEVVMGNHASKGSDIWSAGVVLYRLLAGRLPFPAENLPGLFNAIQNAEPEDLDPLLPSALAGLAMRCLAKDPADRPPSCREALADLEPAQAARVAPAPAVEALPIVGREAERAQLREAARVVLDGLGRAVVLTGEPGVGKSVLAREVVRRTTAQGFRWVRSNVTDMEGLLRPLLRGAREALAGRTSDRKRLGSSSAELLRTLLAEDSPIRLESREQTVWVLERLLSGMAESQPLGVLIDGVHLADPGEQRLVAEMARRLRGSRIVVLLMSDTKLVDLARDEGVLHLRLGPLAPEEVYRLLDLQAEGARLAPEIPKRILEVAEGNPLFTVELFRHLRETGAVVREDDLLRAGHGWRTVSLPRRLRELVALRLRGLPDERRNLVDVAAVDGVAFDGEALAAVLDRSLLEVLRELQHIYRSSGLVAPRLEGWRFANAVIREAIYEELAPDLRRYLDRRLAEHLEERAQREAVDPERLGVHWERAGERKRARPYLNRAALEAARRQEGLRALDLATRSGLFPAGIEAESVSEQADLLFALSGCLSDLGRKEDAEDLLEKMVAATEAIDDEELELRTVVWREDVRHYTKGAGFVDADALRRASEELPDSDERGRARFLLGMGAKNRGDVDGMERWLNLADEVFLRLGNQSMHASTLDLLAQAKARRLLFREAEALYSDAARIASACGRPTSVATSEVNRCLSAFYRGATEDLEPILERAARTFALAGHAEHAALTKTHLARVRYDRGDVRGAERVLDGALRELEALDYPFALAIGALERSMLRAIAGKLVEARADRERAKEAHRENRNIRGQMSVAYEEMHARLFSGDLDGAEAAAREALALLAEDREPRSQVSLALSFSEASLYGLREDVLGDATRLLLEQETPAAAAMDALKAIASGTTEGLELAAEALTAPDIGERRAALKVAAACLRAKALAVRGKISAARGTAEMAVREARKLGHVWLEAVALRLLAAVEPGGDHGVRLRELLETVARTARDESIVGAWMPEAGAPD